MSAPGPAADDLSGPDPTDLDLTERARSRAEPLPEERAAETGAEDREAEAEAILADSEERVADAAESDAPADAADERRASEETI